MCPMIAFALTAVLGIVIAMRASPTRFEGHATHACAASPEVVAALLDGSVPISAGSTVTSTESGWVEDMGATTIAVTRHGPGRLTLRDHEVDMRAEVAIQLDDRGGGCQITIDQVIELGRTQPKARIFRLILWFTGGASRGMADFAKRLAAAAEAS